MKKWFIAFIILFIGGIVELQASSQLPGDEPDDPVLPTVITIVANPDSPRLGDSFDVVISTPEAEGIYYLEAEIGFNPMAVELTGFQPGALFGTDALFVGDYNAANRIGFSITSTGGALSGQGDLFILNFRVPETASAGSYNLSVVSFQARDVDGNLLESESPATVEFTIRSFISWVNLQSPAAASIEYGFSVNVEARIIVPDITSVTGINSDIGAWIGVSADGGDPAQWAESAWLPAEYIQRTGSAHVYRRSIGQNLPAGTYYLASRFNYEEEEYFYGGYSAEGGGFWDGETYVSGVLTVNEPGKMTVVEWNFNDDSRVTSRGIFANLQREFSLVGANFTGFITGSPGRAATSNGWNGNDPELEKYWLANFTTSGLHDLQLSYKMKSSGTGPRDFMLQSSPDAETWSDLLEEPLQLTDNFNHTNIIDFNLPSALYDQPTVYLRWLLVSDRRVSESEDPISATGSSQIDEVKITGRPLLAQFPSVWPGDTNNDGTVDETDVLPLGFFWRASGPARAVTGPSWQAAPAVGWLPLNATYADTDGSGTVNQSDLLAVGLNFGRTQGVTDPDPTPDTIHGFIAGSDYGSIDGSGSGSASISGSGSGSGSGSVSITRSGSGTGTGSAKGAVAGMGTGDGGDSAAGTNTSAHTGTNNSKNGYALIVDADGQSSSPDYTFPQIDEGKMLEIDIMTASGEKLNILGVSYTYNIISGGDQAVEVRNAIPGSWARDGFHPNTMLRFQKKEDGNIAGAVVHKGMVHTDLTGHMLLLRIAASESWDGPLTLGDFRFSYIDAEGNINRIDQVKVDFRVVTATGLPGQPDLPQKIQLYQNYPNPFNPETRIRFDLPEAADVRLDVFTITGQHVATLADEFRPAGHHNITFDAARMSSGVYMYRLKAGSVIQTRKMTLIK